MEACRDPQCIASTGSVYRASIAESKRREALALEKPLPSTSDGDPAKVLTEEESNHFKSAEWSPDGTALITSSADNIVRSFILPTDLLDPRPDPHALLPYSKIHSAEPVHATAVYPRFNLQDTSTTLVLAAPRSHPVALYNILEPTRPVQTFPLIHAPTEIFLTPLSLLFLPSNPSHFLAGSSSLLTIFSLHRRKSLLSLPTIPSTNSNLVGGGVGIRGLVSALAIAPSTGVLAAGTYNRGVGLYDAEGSGDVVAVWNLSPTGASQRHGKGITGLNWSADGRYLFVSERASKGIIVYDVRVTGKEVGFLAGRQAETNQRLDVDMYSAGAEGDEVWAGGRDGNVRMWRWRGIAPAPESGLSKNLEDGVEVKEQDLTFEASTDPVGSAVVHPSGLMLATCSGERRMTHRESRTSPGISEDGSDESSRDSTPGPKPSNEEDETLDNNLKIWLL